MTIASESLGRWPSALAIIARAENAAQRRWAAQAALGIARDLAAASGRVLVVDADARWAPLARTLRVRSSPGIAEVFRKEVGVRAAARPPAGEAFYFMGPGRPGREPILRDRAWLSLVDRLAAGDARLLVYCTLEEWPEPDGIPGVEGAIILDGAGRGCTVQGVNVLAELVAPPEVRLGAVGMPAAEPLREAAEPSREAGAVIHARRPRRMPAATAFVFGTAVLAAAWLLFIPRSGGEGRGSEARRPPSARGSVVVDRAAARALPYSVQVESYSALADAVRRERRLVGVLRAPVVIAPTAIDSVIYYRVFAGLEAEPGSARGLLRRLVEQGIKDSARSGDVRMVPLSFDLGAFHERGDAERRRVELLELGIPAYVVEVPTSAGTGFQVYAGAYENAVEARALAAMLEQQRITAPLIERIGSAR